MTLPCASVFSSEKRGVGPEASWAPAQDSESRLSSQTRALQFQWEHSGPFPKGSKRASTLSFFPDLLPWTVHSHCKQLPVSTPLSLLSCPISPWLQTRVALTQESWLYQIPMAKDFSPSKFQKMIMVAVINLWNGYNTVPIPQCFCGHSMRKHTSSV